jgi:alkane 1-monooxygenase
VRRSSSALRVQVAARFVPHALALILVFAAFSGSPTPFSLVGWLFLIAPLVELALGDEHQSRRSVGDAERIVCGMVPWLWAPIQMAVLIAGLYTLRHERDLVSSICLAVPVGMLTGVFGMAAAHELMHRRSRFGRDVAALLFVSCGYGHFLVEHTRGHHRRAGTAVDPATAKLGESVYAFLPRTLKGGLESAWRLEAERLTRIGCSRFNLRNRLIAMGALSILLCAAAGLVVGLPGVVFVMAQGAVSVAILEIINYIQHYGLVRRESALGNREPVATAWAWDCASRLTNSLLCDLGHHSDHHLRPARRSEELELRRAAPRLPAGYFTMFALALLPPLWMQIMNPRAMLVRARIERGLTPLPTSFAKEEESHAREG